MKAYKCWEEVEDCATIIFAETAGKARYIAIYSGDIGDDLTFKDVRVRRVPQLDKYYRGLREMDWYDDNDRVAMVREGAFDGCCEDYLEYEDCNKCSARKWCATYERHKDDYSNQVNWDYSSHQNIY